MVRTVVYAEDEIENSPLGEWNMTADGTPFMRQLTTNYQNPEPHWPFWPYRTTLIRKHQKERTWTVVELARRFKRMRQPFGMIDQFLLTVGFEDECETLTLLGVEEQNLTQLGLVAVGEDGDEIRDAEELVVTGLRDEQSSFPSKAAASSKVPDVLPPDDGGQHKEVPEMEAGDEIQAAPEVRLEMDDEILEINEDLTITPTSTVKLLRDACRWLGISQSGSKRQMSDRCSIYKTFKEISGGSISQKHCQICSTTVSIKCAGCSSSCSSSTAQ